MREPGEDDEVGEYWQLTPPPQAHPSNVCGCAKPEGCYGRWGWHFNPAGAAYERCPAYSAVVARNEPGRAGVTKGRKGGRR